MAKAIITKRTDSGYSATDGDGNRVRISYPAHVQGVESKHFEAAKAKGTQ